MTPPPATVTAAAASSTASSSFLQQQQTDDLLVSDRMHFQQQRLDPKESLHNLTDHITDAELKLAIRKEIKRLVTDYDRLLSVLQQRSEILEQEFESLQLTEESYQKRYEKAVREMQFFKKKYEKAISLNNGGNRPRSPSMESNHTTSTSSTNEHYQVMSSAATLRQTQQQTPPLPALPSSPPPIEHSNNNSFHVLHTQHHLHSHLPQQHHPHHPLPPPSHLPPLPSLPEKSSSGGKHLSRSSSSSTTSSNASGTPFYNPANQHYPHSQHHWASSSLSSPSADNSSNNGSNIPTTPTSGNNSIPLPFRLRQNSNATAATSPSSASGASSTSSHSNGQTALDEKTQYHSPSPHHYSQGRKGSWQHPNSVASSGASGPPLPTSTASSSSSPAAVTGGNNTNNNDSNTNHNGKNKIDNLPLTPPIPLSNNQTSATAQHQNTNSNKNNSDHINRSATNASQAGYINQSVVQQRKVDPLSFGGSDAFWDTISRHSTNDTNTEKMISNFLRRGGSPNTAKQSPSYKNVKYGYGMLHTMIVLKSSAALDLLIQHGANPNAITLSIEEEKTTPGYLASSIGWLQGLQSLVEAGCDLTLARGSGLRQKTALQVAAEHCHTTVVEYIISLTPPQYHAQVDGMGATVLHYAAASGHTELVSYFIQTCQLLSVDQMDNRGETCLHWASRHGHLEVASLLIERCGCDFNAYTPVTRQNKMGSGCTPLDLAKAGGHKRLIEYYKKLGALTAKKMDKKREEELEKTVPVHLESALSKNGLFGF